MSTSEREPRRRLSARASSPLLGTGLLLLAAVSAQAQIATGSYVGDGTAPRAITGIGFRPDIVIVKVDFTNATSDTCSSAVIRTSTMAGDASKLMSGVPLLVAPCPSPSTGLIPNLVRSLDANGFTVGSDERVNAALAACGGANCTYHWIALRANGNLRLGTYTGSGGTQSITGLAFSPEYVIVLPANNNKAYHRTSAGGLRSNRFDAGGDTNTGITSLDADGFSVASASAPDNLNAAAVTYHYAAWNAAPGTTAVGTYAGDNTDNRPIDLPGLPPRYVIVQSLTGGGSDAIQRTATMAGDVSINFRNAVNTNRIQALRPLGFEVGTYTGVNNVGESYAFVAFGDGADNPCSTGGSWWNAAWGRRRRIVFNNSGQAEDLVDFPVLVKLDSSRVEYARTQNAGQDLRFVDADNQTVLAHEIELWNEAGTSYVWVKVPRVNASSASDFIYMYYDNAGAPDGQSAAAVWNSGHRGVWHLKETPPAVVSDSTANANHGTPEFSPVQTAGQIDGSLQFDGTNERDVNVPDNATLQLPTNMTVSGWAWTTSSDDQSRLIVAKWQTGTSANYWLGKLNTGPGLNSLNFGVDGGPTAGAPLSLVNDGLWHHVVGVADATALQLRLYVDGIERATNAYTGTSQTGTSELRIGRSPDATLQTWVGGIDEVRVENVARSAAWIRAQHLSMIDGFVSFGSEVGACQLRSIGSSGPYTAGTLTATNGSWLVTGSGTAWRANNRGRGDRITIDGTHYTILAVGSDTELRLSSVFTGTSGPLKTYTIARKFGTLDAWEDCVDGGAGTCPFFPDNTASLVSDNRSEIGIAYKDSVFGLGADMSILGSTTDATHTITLTADGINRHNGTAGAGVIVDSQLGPNEILVRDANVTVEWLELRGLRGGDNDALIRPYGGLAKNILLQNLLIHDFYEPAVGINQSGIRLSDVAGKTVTIRNVMIWDGDQLGIAADEAGDALTIENCSIDDIRDTSGSTRRGVFADLTPGVIVRNTVVTRSGTDFAPGSGSFAPGPTSSHNISSDATAPGASALTAQTAANLFVTPGSDLHLKAGANTAVDSGLDLSTGFSTDINNQLRPAGAAWDRGADERDATTEVKLQSFGALPGDGSVTLEWWTASELNNLGFHVYRALGADGPWTRLNASLIPGLGSSAVGQAYSFRDTGLVNGTRYYYRLEDIDASSKTTSHGPVFAVPSADAGSGTSEGGTSRGTGEKPKAAASCPDWVLTAYGSSVGSSSSVSLSCTRHGDPEAVSLGVLSRDSRQATLELRTGGFYALREPAGGVRVFVPGFDFPSDPQAAALPLRRALVEAVVGRRVQLGGVRALDPVGFPGLVPSALGKAEMQVSWDGTVRAARRAVRAQAPRRAAGDLVKLLPSVFQGETKSAVVEISPLRFDARRQQLVLARRVRVQLLFAGRETGESGRGRVGRAPGARKPVSGELLARLYTTRLGLHAVSFEQLFPGRRRGLAASTLRLERQGEVRGFHIEPASASFGPGSRLYFHADRAAASTDFSSETSWELLNARDGVQLPLVSAAPAGDAVSSPSTGQASFEANRFYQPGLLDAPDLWLWEGLASGATRAMSFALTGVDAASSQAAVLDVFLQGASESSNPVDHHVSASVNGVPVGEAQYAGKKPYRMSLSVPQSLLREGANELGLTNVPDTGASSYVFLDRFTVSYAQASALAGGVFEGTWSEGGTVTLAGLTAPAALLDVTATGPAGGGGALWLTGYEATGGGLRFRAEAGHRYLAVSGQALLTPRVVAPAPSSLRSTTNQADYLLITPRAFLAAAEPLVQRRQDQGLNARAVSFEEIADEFGHGQPSAEAIHSFLGFAYHSWTGPSPRYVLLLGDSSYDPRNFSGTAQPSPLPALWTKTSYLWTVSDPELAAVNGADSLPDLAIGRLPATSVEEAGTLVQKLLAWEDSGQGLSGRAALVADNPDLAGDFEADIDDIAQSFLQGREVSTLKLGALGGGMRPAIREALDSGLGLLSYVGHGGAAVWASENVWNSWDAASLQAQSRQPLLVTMNCLNGYFVAPAYNSLAESLLKAEGRGAIAGFSPSGLSLDGPAHQYHRALVAELTGGQHERLGDALLAAQAAYAQTGLMPELLAVYHLLGDPATRIR
jgi:hypothetical protein